VLLARRHEEQQKLEQTLASATDSAPSTRLPSVPDFRIIEEEEDAREDRPLAVGYNSTALESGSNSPNRRMSNFAEACSNLRQSRMTFDEGTGVLLQKRIDAARINPARFNTARLAPGKNNKLHLRPSIDLGSNHSACSFKSGRRGSHTSVV
jgi:hypothetical protein